MVGTPQGQEARGWHLYLDLLLTRRLKLKRSPLEPPLSHLHLSPTLPAHELLLNSLASTRRAVLSHSPTSTHAWSPHPTMLPWQNVRLRTRRPERTKCQLGISCKVWGKSLSSSDFSSHLWKWRWSSQPHPAVFWGKWSKSCKTLVKFFCRCLTARPIFLTILPSPVPLWSLSNDRGPSASLIITVVQGIVLIYWDWKDISKCLKWKKKE